MLGFKPLLIVFILCLLAVLAFGCNAGQMPLVPPETAAVQTPLSSASPSMQNPNSGPSSLFLDTSAAGNPKPGQAVVRSRWVKIDRGMLMDGQGMPLRLPPNTEIILNLFPDTSFTAVIDKVYTEGGVQNWVGHLKGVQPSSVTIVYTAGVFMGHFASPQGIYEVSNAGGDLYQLIQIDQSKLPGGEGEVPDSRLMF